MPKKNRNPNDAQNPIGPIDKPKNTDIAGLSDDTHVVYSEEHDSNDGD